MRRYNLYSNNRNTGGTSCIFIDMWCTTLCADHTEKSLLETMSCASGLTTIKVMRVTRARFIQFSSRRQVDDCMVDGILGSALFGLSD
ncbi:hypothetical protein DVH24_025393 [Malus domestica]|uniref:Uncharacterized protein n=1 Tax=Malus domestica TaxID=3750 RepID=A0A498HPQ3_MALDO|nr:hypothetical protein DVH24_025393 [Malus domestica]